MTRSGLKSVGRMITPPLGVSTPAAALTTGISLLVPKLDVGPDAVTSLTWTSMPSRLS